MLSPGTLMAWILIPIVVIIFLIIGTAIFIGLMTTKASEPGGSSGLDTTSALIGLAILVIFVVMIGHFIRNRAPGDKWTRWYRLFTFAAANGLSAHPHTAHRSTRVVFSASDTTGLRTTGCSRSRDDSSISATIATARVQKKTR